MRILSSHLFSPKADGLPIEINHFAEAFPEIRSSKARLVLALSTTAEAPAFSGAKKTRRLLWAEIGPFGLDGAEAILAVERDGRLVRDGAGFSGANPFSLIAPALRGEARTNGERTDPASQAGAVLEARKLAREFLARLDARILRALAKTDLLSPDAYEWCAIDPERRSEALLSWPIWAEAMIGRGGAVHRAVEGALRCGGSLEDAMVREFGADRSVVKALSRVSVRLVNGRRQSSSVAKTLARTPPALRPRTAREWASWHVLRAMIETCSWTFGLSESEQDELFIRSAADKPWMAALADVGVRNAEAAIRSAKDCLAAFRNGIVVPTAIGTGCGNAAIRTFADGRGKAWPKLFKTIVGNGGLPALLRLSDAWHLRIGRAERLSEKETKEIPDDAIVASLGTRTFVLDEELVVTPLETAGALRNEGRLMRHCIGGYVDRAALGRIMAFHVSDAGGNEITATLRRADPNSPWIPDDARLAGDADVPDSENLLERLAKVANAGSTIVCEETIRNYNEKSGLNGMFRQPEIGRARAETAWAAWSPILPKRLRAPSAQAALEGPLFDVGAALCLKGWMTGKRKAIASERRKTAMAA
jgi:hypothetical protein